MIKDGKNNNIVVSIEIETITYSHNVRININRIKSVYGFNNLRGYDLNDYIKKNLSENKFKKVYEKKEHGTGFSTAASSSSMSNIS